MNTFASDYYPLLEVQILHRYFLNVGKTGFDEDPAAPDIQAARRAYQVRDFWRIEPDEDTRELLRRLGLRFRLTATGFRLVATRDGAAASLPDKTSFSFLVYLVDPRFMLYTAIDPAVQKRLAQADGHVFVWRNTADGMSLNTDEKLAIYEEPGTEYGLWSGPSMLPRTALPAQVASGPDGPVGVIQLRHRRWLHQLWQEDGQPLTQPFSALLANSATHWAHISTKHNDGIDLSNGQRLNGYVLGNYPLTRYGYQAVADRDGRLLPNPTPATTFQGPDKLLSLIY